MNIEKAKQFFNEQAKLQKTYALRMFKNKTFHEAIRSAMVVVAGMMALFIPMCFLVDFSILGLLTFYIGAGCYALFGCFVLQMVAANITDGEAIFPPLPEEDDD